MLNIINAYGIVSNSQHINSSESVVFLVRRVETTFSVNFFFFILIHVDICCQLSSVIMSSMFDYEYIYFGSAKKIHCCGPKSIQDSRRTCHLLH